MPHAEIQHLAVGVGDVVEVQSYALSRLKVLAVIVEIEHGIEDGISFVSDELEARIHTLFDSQIAGIRLVENFAQWDASKFAVGDRIEGAHAYDSGTVIAALARRVAIRREDGHIFVRDIKEDDVLQPQAAAAA